MSRSYGSRDAAIRSTRGRTADSRESGDRLTASSLIRVYSCPFVVPNRSVRGCILSRSGRIEYSCLPRQIELLGRF